jgi:uncharacterized protein YgiM (DUF1202 family)
MLVRFEPPLDAVVIENYDAEYPEASNLCAGESIRLEKRDGEWKDWVWCKDRKGRSGWVPQSFINSQGEQEADQVTCDYSAAELSVHVGERVTLSYEEASWYWAANEDGYSGWVPAKCVQLVG